VPDPGLEESAAGYDYDLFVSYASEDLEPVERLVKRLGDDGYALWFDKTDMMARGTVADNLKQALGRCRQTLICLSDAYCKKDYTRFEVQLNFEMDPANLRERTISAVVRGPLTAAVPAQIVCVPRVDLTDAAKYEMEYQRLKRSILPASQPLPAFPMPAEIMALRKLSTPVEVLVAIRRRAVELFSYMYRKELGEAAPADLMKAAEALANCKKLSADIRLHIRTIPDYAKLIDGEFSRDSTEPAFQALLRLSLWACQRYGDPTPAADPFLAFWDQVVPHLPSADLPFQLAGNRRGLTAAGAVFLGQGTEGGSQWDLSAIPSRSARATELSSEVDCCKGLGEKSPLAVEWHKGFEFPSIGAWRLIASRRPHGVSIPALVERFRPLPERLAGAVFRETWDAYSTLAAKAPVLAASLFRLENVVLDRAGSVRLAWNWDRPGAKEETVSIDNLWFCRPAGGATAAAEFASAGDALKAALRQAIGVEPAPAGQGSASGGEDRHILHVVVDSFLERKDLPDWLKAVPLPPPPPPPQPVTEAPPEPQPVPGPAPVPPAVPVQDRWRIPVDCHCAWPLGTDRILAWGLDDSLAIYRFEDGSMLWSDAGPFHWRVGALAPDGGVAVGSWEGEVHWFGAEGLEGSARLDGPIGDIRPLAGRWLAGSWNEKLKLLGGHQPAAALPDVTDGVRRIAAGAGDLFAVLSLQNCVSLYRAGHRVAQIGPLFGARDLAFSRGCPLVLTAAGLVTIDSSGKPGTPDHPPSRTGVQLLASPPNPACLLVNDQGQSWIVDEAGTYPRGPRLPGGRNMTTACGFDRCVAQTQIGFTYWRNGAKVRSWRDAVCAVLSPDGQRVVAALPGEVEVFRDSA
jgi:hypothetical protein